MKIDQFSLKPGTCLKPPTMEYGLSFSTKNYTMHIFCVIRSNFLFLELFQITILKNFFMLSENFAALALGLEANFFT